MGSAKIGVKRRIKLRWRFLASRSVFITAWQQNSLEEQARRLTTTKERAE
jgi:hypothetical protein